VAKEEHDEEYPRNVQVLETKGEQSIEEPYIEYVTYTQPIKTQKVNIGMPKNPKFAQIGEYWSDEIVEKIPYLLQEYQYLFPTNFQR
jgi:hypothetical protein